MSFGTFIRDHRTALGLSLRVVAQRLGVDPAHLSRVEANKAPASEQLIRRLARVLQCQEDELLLLAGRLPEAIRALVVRQPYRSAAALRTMAEMCVAEPGAPYEEPIIAERGERAIEDGFPFEQVSEIAEAESWRKEVYLSRSRKGTGVPTSSKNRRRNFKKAIVGRSGTSFCSSVARDDDISQRH